MFNRSNLTAQQNSAENGPRYAAALGDGGFTLAELLVSMAVLVLLFLFFTQLINSAATIVTVGNKGMDTDSQARQLLDRMAIDFDQMLKRTDVSYYVKTVGNTETGNDQIAFFSAVPGYYSQTGYNSNTSLVAYRVNADPNSASYNNLERMGKGLALNGAYTASIPLLFLDGTTGTTIQGVWPAAASSSGTDSDCSNTGCYETAGPQVFRFEYYYLLSAPWFYNPTSPHRDINGYTLSLDADNNGGLANQLSTGPWSSTNTFSVKDVAAIVVAIAVIEPKSKVLLSNDQIAALAGTLPDFTTGWAPGQLLVQWRAALDANANGLPGPAISGVRVYERYFYLSQ
jgi:prepilin-type N-terminal cleavage/methylation domain-containing protein